MTCYSLRISSYRLCLQTGRYCATQRVQVPMYQMPRPQSTHIHRKDFEAKLDLVGSTGILWEPGLELTWESPKSGAPKTDPKLQDPLYEHPAMWDPPIQCNSQLKEFEHTLAAQNDEGYEPFTRTLCQDPSTYIPFKIIYQRGPQKTSPLKGPVANLSLVKALCAELGRSRLAARGARRRFALLKRLAN